MPKVPVDGSNDQIIYPVDLMRGTAAKIVAQVSSALDQHNRAWQQAQNYIQAFRSDMQGPLMDLLTPYDQRLRASYQWQLDFASALFAAVDAMEATDNGIAQSFSPGRGPHAF